ncbi:hypothetical protein BY996DRAFT_6607091 [Phakopsora pachyrhizi]|nr:hypothetical protein BY996DRAFT_6607091 [Phakopsora pachyrhizi]
MENVNIAARPQGEYQGLFQEAWLFFLINKTPNFAAMIKRINMVAVNNPNANEQHLKFLQNEQLSKLKRLIKGVSFDSKTLPSISSLSKRVKVSFESDLAKAGITRFTFDWSATPESKCAWNAVIVDVLLPSWVQWARGSKLHLTDEELPGIRQLSQIENVQVQGNAPAPGPSVIHSFNKSIPGSYKNRKQGGVSMGPMDITQHSNVSGAGQGGGVKLRPGPVDQSSASAQDKRKQSEKWLPENETGKLYAPLLRQMTNQRPNPEGSGNCDYKKDVEKVKKKESIGCGSED